LGSLGRSLVPPDTLDPAEIETDWRTWLYAVGDRYLRGTDGELLPLARRHEEMWEWAWGIGVGVRPAPFTAIWPRGGGKSTTAELVLVHIAAFLKRKYCLYVCSTQERADDHVANVAALLESKEVATYYPEIASRAIGKFGNPKGWRRNRLRTRNGFTLDAIGLDTAARGAKIEDARPGMMVIDDIDEQGDTVRITNKKIKTLTGSLLPAGSSDLAVLAVQNLVTLNGVFSRLANVAEYRADFLVDRILSGPHPAIEDPEYEEDAAKPGRVIIVGGRPTWLGQDIPTCQSMIDTFGFTSFNSECQHEVEPPPGGAYDHLTFEECEPADVPVLLKISVAVDPAITNTDQSDSNGIQIDGLGVDRKLYRLYSWEARSSPEATIERAIFRTLEMIEYYRAPAKLIFESNQGGDLWRMSYGLIWTKLKAAGRIPEGQPMLRFSEVKATRDIGSKIVRGNEMLADYEVGRFVHVRGATDMLKRALRRWPLTAPHDLADAAYWSSRDLVSALPITGILAQGSAQGWFVKT
jgi:hypothetical protein